ncbi:type VI secretion system baseplate subunit TssE [Vibrio cincinnatiensis]|uniref:type VI secretion system baseplate subunit TssE n=1 Tax=Vibrio cincinnatiensis TaxID=675 RepID=UPI001EE0E9B1|nr:type VI secretion system baseplate subunit TssE [Vibrio cincinnatiensis]MCG3733393.1 type VI secretion system baseplate subunit TssE [Vibrio cincinnatiensis]MCG3740768.1 type VI secretion system baseplate subunit TssE [Vibrio cincinnatiensis]MCG3744254.1 type VI secretion system baseplate subunit TssE [Vibrio cincinnatiensis]MCG3761989.1 type VI secretion system baseplate subunit TssE [Vibrio cincinnatiensis]
MNELSVMPSLLDKLVDYDPESHYDKYYPLTRHALMDSIRLDLEALLNSRINWQSLPEELRELSHSILRYGLPDFSSMPFSSADGQQFLCNLVQKTVIQFEPRLSYVTVSIAEDKNPLDRILKLRIRATCIIDGTEQELVMDSEVEPVSLGIKLSKAK